MAGAPDGPIALRRQAWWLSPELSLERAPGTVPDPSSRLDLLLQSKARDGVEVYVLLFASPKPLGLNSAKVAQKLTALHPEIRSWMFRA